MCTSATTGRPIVPLEGPRSDTRYFVAEDGTVRAYAFKKLETSKLLPGALQDQLSARVQVRSMSAADVPPADETVSTLLQSRRRADFLEHPIKEGWITVHESWRNNEQNGLLDGVLAPIRLLSEFLEDCSLHFDVRDSRPSCSMSNGPGRDESIEYHRLGDHGGLEPLVLMRDFHGLRPKYVELIEEFRLFHNLYEDRQTNKLLKFDDAGQANEVVRIEQHRVRVRARELRQFLAIKEMALLLQIHSIRHSDLRIDSVAEFQRQERHKDDESCWRFNVYENEKNVDEHNSMSEFAGIAAVRGVDKSESDFWPYNENQEETYQEFIIGADSNGEHIRFSCDPDKLSNYFGKNPGSPHHITPVFFRREVMQRYYSNPALYSVEDGAIRCGGLWYLAIDNHLRDVVSAYLGDLGEQLPASEREYWLPFNVQSDAGISSVTHRRDFDAEFTDPEKPDLLFKYRLEQFGKAWEKKFGWPLFKPLSSGDEHLLTTLREPLNDEQGEFDSQILALTKILIDSLNEPKLRAQLPMVPENTKGIDKLKLFLEQGSVASASETIECLRLLQSLRSTGVSHRKGSKFDKAAATARLNDKGVRVVFREILTSVRTNVLELIGDHYLDSGWR